MRKFQLLLLLLLSFSIQSFAKDGYRLQVKLNDKRDSMVYLAYYFGKSLPTIFKVDSARLDKNGMAHFEKKTKITGGIYIVLPEDRKSFFEILLLNGDDFSVIATMSELPESVKFKNSPENEEYAAYQLKLKGMSEQQQKWVKDLAAAKTKKDTAAIRDKSKEANRQLIAFRKSYIAQHPGSMLSSIFSALESPEVPEGDHFFPNGTKDSTYAYRYYKAHYWDGFNFRDDRLIHTPLLEMKLDEYFNKILYQHEDTVIMYADSILAKLDGMENLYKFTLNWLSTNAQTTKVMGMDKVFVHLVENYFMRGKATWLSNDDLKKYIDRYEDLKYNSLSAPAPEFKAVDLDKKIRSLYDFKAKYTLLIFYSPDCGHCIHEMPLIDSVYRAVLKDKGVKVMAFNVDIEELKWREFITKHHLEDWLHVWDPQRKSKYWSLYDVQTTPSIYLLDENKIIRGKKLAYSTLERALEIAEIRKKGSAK